MSVSPAGAATQTLLPQDEASFDYALVAEAIRYLETHFRGQPSLEELAAGLHISPFHLQRVFTRWAGISPKRFLQYLTADYAKTLLGASHSVLDATYSAGLSGPGRLHDLMVTLEAVTPGEFKSRGEGLTIRVGRHATPFGDCLLATTARGIVALNFVDDDVAWEAGLAALTGRWPGAQIVHDPGATASLAAAVFGEARPQTPLHLLVKGTNFQVKVWEALLRIPAGAVCTYGDVARAIDQPRAVRAVGGAVGANAIAYLIPCHRVIRQGGVVSDYAWGATRKRALLGWEAATAATMALDKEAARA